MDNLGMELLQWTYSTALCRQRSMGLEQSKAISAGYATLVPFSITVPLVLGKNQMGNWAMELPIKHLSRCRQWARIG